MVHCAEHAVGIWREIYADNLWRLIAYNVQETRILVSETIVILTPDGRSQEDVERCNLLSPGDFLALLEPLAVLVDHAVNDVDEWFVAVEHTVATSEDVAFEPTCEDILV